MSVRAKQSQAAAEAIETRNQNLQLLGDYIIEGAALESDVLVALMREPDVVADELVGDGRLASMIIKKTVKAGGDVPEVKARFEQTQAMVAKARELGFGASDFNRGSTATTRTRATAQHAHRRHSTKNHSVRARI